MALNELSPKKIENAKPKDTDYKLTDGGSLYLLVKKNGTKAWRMNYRFNGKQATLALGVYPDVPLATARKRRDEARELLADGRDPREAKRSEKDEPTSPTFENVAREWHSGTMGHPEWKEITRTKILREMENHLFPAIGSKPIDTLKTRDLLPMLIEMTRQGIGATTGRVKTTMGSIFRYAVQRGIVDYNPAHDLKGAIINPKVRHRPALPLERLPELMAKAVNYTGRPLTRLAVLFSLHTFVRSSELRHARWEEIDIENGLWTIPGQREKIAGVKYSDRGAKMGAVHYVPLSTQAIKVLEEIQKISGEYLLIFPGDSNPYKPMSENTVNKALRTMGYDTQADVCLHGFRAMACSALTESGLWSRDAVERQMSHQERNEVRAAYVHLAQHMQERRQMMQW
ncbi:TPA: integrase arm-type DNA-binding domain-containing protein, partial [Enterobacter roggenkampii]|nr:integrase arm-type DNA-binding domain-containing protein [Enterobacter roggenkampii]HCR0897643.1 integrase arm-type DNA-binding domain-containing protein [Enterobacter roggenkampii]HEM8763272.1 integrase arm-type DNA-binding domain-containing protein [Enterobacter roggenkampii]